MKLSNTLVAPLAAILIVTGAGAVLATTNNHPATTGSDTVAQAADATPAPVQNAPKAPAAPKNALLKGVLDALVTKGTITAAQETAILDAVTAKKVDLRTKMQEARALWKEILADGIITQAELDKLPADSPMRDLSKLMTNGQISVKDLRGMGFALRGMMGGGRGPGMMGGAGAPPAP